MKKNSGTILAVVLGVLAFIGALAVVAYFFRDKLRAICGCHDEDEDYCDPDYFEFCDDEADEEAEEEADAEEKEEPTEE